MQNFGRQIQGADVALFYYAGHGVQVSGSNYLVPVSANPTREADVDFQMVDVNLVLRQMQGSGTRLNLVILDACRNNPFGARGLRASDGGLAQMRAPEGTLISYATQPGSVAQDGNDGHSPYTKALASTIRLAGLDIFQTFNQVGLAVKRQTGGSQQPWVSSSPIDGTFYFVPPVATASPQVAAAPPRLSDTLRPDPDRIPIKDTVLLRELSDRRSPSRSVPPPRWRNPAAPAAASAATKSRCPARGRRLARSRPKSRCDEASPKPKSRAAPHGKVAVVAAARVEAVAAGSRESSAPVKSVPTARRRRVDPPPV